MKTSSDFQTLGVVMLAGTMITGFLAIVVLLPIVRPSMLTNSPMAGGTAPDAHQGTSTSEPIPDDFWQRLNQSSDSQQQTFQDQSAGSPQPGDPQTFGYPQTAAYPTAENHQAATFTKPIAQQPFTQQPIAQQPFVQQPLAQQPVSHTSMTAFQPASPWYGAPAAQPMPASAPVVQNAPVTAYPVLPYGGDLRGAERLPPGSVYAPVTVHPVTVNVDGGMFGQQIQSMNERLEKILSERDKKPEQIQAAAVPPVQESLPQQPTVQSRTLPPVVFISPATTQPVNARAISAANEVPELSPAEVAEIEQKRLAREERNRERKARMEEEVTAQELLRKQQLERFSRIDHVLESLTASMLTIQTNNVHHQKQSSVQTGDSYFLDRSQPVPQTASPPQDSAGRVRVTLAPPEVPEVAAPVEDPVTLMPSQLQPSSVAPMPVDSPPAIKEVVPADTPANPEKVDGATQNQENAGPQTPVPAFPILNPDSGTSAVAPRRIPQRSFAVETPKKANEDLLDERLYAKPRGAGRVSTGDPTVVGRPATPSATSTPDATVVVSAIDQNSAKPVNKSDSQGKPAVATRKPPTLEHTYRFSMSGAELPRAEPSLTAVPSAASAGKPVISALHMPATRPIVAAPPNPRPEMLVSAPPANIEHCVAVSSHTVCPKCGKIHATDHSGERKIQQTAHSRSSTSATNQNNTPPSSPGAGNHRPNSLGTSSISSGRKSTQETRSGNPHAPNGRTSTHQNRSDAPEEKRLLPRLSLPSFGKNDRQHEPEAEKPSFTHRMSSAIRRLGQSDDN